MSAAVLSHGSRKTYIILIILSLYKHTYVYICIYITCMLDLLCTMFLFLLSLCSGE